MSDFTREELKKLAKKWGLNSIKKPKGVEDVIKMTPDVLANLGLDDVKRSIIALAQQAIFLQYQFNGSCVSEIKAKKGYNNLLTEKALLEEGSTQKAREGLAIKKSDELKKLRDEYERAEIRVKLLNEIPDRIVELINSLKVAHRHKLYELKHAGKE